VACNVPLLRLAILLLCLPGPLLAVDSRGAGVANLMRGMITGLSLLGQASNANQGLNYPGLGMPGALGYPGMLPGASPWGSVPWAGVPWATPGMPGPGQSGPYWPPGNSFSAPFGSSPYYPSPYRRINAALLRYLQGSWETTNGGLLIVDGHLARLYLSRDRYQDLELTLNDHYLWVRPVGNRQGYVERYEHRFFDGRIILRDERGRTLLLQRFVPDEENGRAISEHDS
jgi:hypothetical protein